MHGLAFSVQEGLPFARILQNSADFYLFLAGFTWFSVLILFPLSSNFFIFMHSFLFYFI